MTGSMVFLLLVAAQSAAAVWILASPGLPRRRLRSLDMPSGGNPGQPAAGASLSYGLRAWRETTDRLRALRQRGARERRVRAEVMELCFALAVELRAGRTSPEALERAVQAVMCDLRDGATRVLAAARTGGDVVQALRVAGADTGAEGLRRLAACWQVGAGSGAGFALTVERLAGALRTEEQHRHEVAAQLAGPRSTGRLLAVLPLLGLLMSAAMGMQPFDFLLGTPYGLVCLVLGVVLDALGVFWTGRLARSASEGR